MPTMNGPDEITSWLNRRPEGEAVERNPTIAKELHVLRNEDQARHVEEHNSAK